MHTFNTGHPEASHSQIQDDSFNGLLAEPAVWSQCEEQWGPVKEISKIRKPFGLGMYTFHKLDCNFWEVTKLLIKMWNISNML